VNCEPTPLEILKNEIKNAWKMEQYIFRHPGSLELRILQQALLYLIISPMPSVSLKSSLSLYWLVFSPLKVFYLNFFACSIMWMVNKMRWLPYGATTKRMDNTETLFGNLKNWRRKMDEKWKCVKNRHNRDAHSKDFRPIFNNFSLQFLFNFTANLTFFAVKLKENWNENWPKIGYHECPGREILEKQVKIGSKPEPEGVWLTGWNGTPSCCR